MSIRMSIGSSYTTYICDRSESSIAIARLAPSVERREVNLVVVQPQGGCLAGTCSSMMYHDHAAVDGLKHRSTTGSKYSPKNLQVASRRNG